MTRVNKFYFLYDWKKDSWNLYFAAGIIIGGFIAAFFLSAPGQVNISAATTAVLRQEVVKDFNGMLPQDIFRISQLFTVRGFIFTVIGGFLVGFGTRYAGGCTSGHAIMGL